MVDHLPTFFGWLFMFVGGAIILTICGGMYALAEKLERKTNSIKLLTYLLKGIAYIVSGIFILFCIIFI